MRILTHAYFAKYSENDLKIADLNGEECKPTRFVKNIVSFPINEDTHFEEILLISKEAQIKAVRVYFSFDDFYDVDAPMSVLLNAIENYFGAHTNLIK